MNGAAPRLAVALLRRFLPRADADAILGDLLEVYALRCRRGRLGARLWIWAQVALTPWRVVRGHRSPRVFGRWFAAVGGDLRVAARRLRARPLLVGSCVAIVALGVAASTTVYAIFDSLVFPKLGTPVAGELRGIELTPEGGTPTRWMPLPRFVDLATTLDRPIAGFVLAPANVRREDRVRQIGVDAVVGDYFRLLEAPTPQVGRYFGRVGSEAPREVVLSHTAALEWFDSAAEAVGASLLIERQDFLVVGVAPPGFRGASLFSTAPIWVPAPSILDTEGERPVQLIALVRLEDERELAASSEQISALLDDTASGQPPRVRLATMGEIWMGNDLPSMLLLWALVSGLAALVLLVACLNIAGVLLAEAMGRRGELGVRRALGASRAQLVRLVLSEAWLMAALAAGIAVVVSRSLLIAIPGWLPINAAMIFPQLRLQPLGVVLSVLLAVVAISMAGVGPALRAVRRPARVGTAHSSAARRGRTRAGLLVAQAAVSVLLLIVAATLSQRLGFVHGLPLGYEEEDRYTFRVDLGPATRDPAAGHLLLEDLVDRVAAVPGVSSATRMISWPFNVPTSTPVRARIDDLATTDARRLVVGSGYLETLGVRLVQGRDLSHDGSREALVSVGLAASLWNQGAPLEESVYVGADPEPYRLVGVVGDGSYTRDTVQPAVIVPIAVAPSAAAAIVLHSGRDARSLARDVHSAMREVDPFLAPPVLAPIRNWFERAWLLPRAMASLARVFGIVALAIAAVGIYSASAAAVAERRAEIGVRIAIGASPSQVQRQLLVRTTGVVLAGSILGALGGWLAVAGLGSLIPGIEGVAPAATGSLIALLVVVALGASLHPSRSAARTDPALTIRS